MHVNNSYVQFVKDLKQNIVHSRYVAARLANREQLTLYLKVGKMLSEKVAAEKWGAKVLEQLSQDLQRELPGLRGFSSGNLKKMRIFAEAYHRLFPIGSTLSNQLETNSEKIYTSLFGSSVTNQLTLPFEQFIELFFSLSFSHHLHILIKIKDWIERLFYIKATATQFWSLAILEHHIEADLYRHQGKISGNFNTTLPANLKASALQVFQDEYLFDFINTDDTADERIVESHIIANIRQFIMKLGKGFSFIGNQYRLEVSGQEFFLDLLFYNRHLQCLVVFELKRGHFKPEYAGQLNFYLNVLDDKVKLPHEHPSIGIVLCKEKDNTVVEYAVKTIDKAMGVATFKTSKQVPKEMRDILPDAATLAGLLHPQPTVSPSS